MDRRQFLGTGAVASVTGSAAAAPAAGLREKFFGCIAGCHAGSAMGAPVEGWLWERIEKEHGTLDKPLSYEHYRNGWKREPGTTEDGVERQKLIVTAILEKQDRVTAEDVRRAWVRDIKHPGMVSEPFEAVLLSLAKTPVAADEIGKYCDYSGLITLARSCHPIGLINAGDAAGALEDIFDVGRLYNTPNSRGIQWGSVTAVAIAAATKPGATVDSVIGAVFDNCDKGERKVGIRGELERGLKLAAKCKDFKELRSAYDAVYGSKGIPYANSYANEVMTKAISIFSLVKGNTWQAMIAGINFGRDTDCCAAVAAGISGALSGAGSIPRAIVDQVDKAAKMNQYTCSQRTLRETSDGLFAAFQARIARLKVYTAEMEKA